MARNTTTENTEDKVVDATTLDDTSVDSTENKKKYVMQENVIHDGIEYKKGTEVVLSSELKKLFKSNQFIK